MLECVYRKAKKENNVKVFNRIFRWAVESWNREISFF